MDDENPDFIDCVDCGGEFYKGDLDADHRCLECQERIDGMTSDG